MVMNVNKLLTQNNTTMFNADTKFIIHGETEPCRSSEEENSDEQDMDTNIDELLDGFAWAHKGRRLYQCLRQQLDDPPEPYLLIDVLRFCCTPANKFSGEMNDRKMLSILKTFRTKGVKIPQAFLTRVSVKKLF